VLTALVSIADPGSAVADDPGQAGRAGGSGRPDVLLITVDTLRPDALGWVAGKNATPAIDALAAGGLAFPGAVAPVPLTLPSHASLMTGRLPRRHGVRDNGQVLGPEPPTLAEALAAAGYRTAAFVSGFPLDEGFGLGRGFEVYDDRLPDGAPGRAERPAPATTAAAVAWLAGEPGHDRPGDDATGGARVGAHGSASSGVGSSEPAGGRTGRDDRTERRIAGASEARRPWFLWVHYYDPHHPYEPPAALVRPGPRGAYDGEVAAVDRAVGELLAAGAAAAGPAGLVTVLTADHGESLGEHGEAQHGFFVYDATVLVPLVLCWPGTIEPLRSDAPVRLTDVAPTLLSLLGLPPLAGADGVALAGLGSGREPAAEPAYLETWQPWTSYGWAPLRAVRDRRWKLIAAPRPELYDLAADPGETRNLVDDERPVARRLQAVLREVESRPAATAATATDPEAAARLRALGYLGGGTAPRGEPPAGLPDPKDRLALRDLLTEGEEAMDAGRPRQALERFEAVIAADPANRFAWFRAGSALLALGDAAGAVERLEKAVALDPGRAESRLALAGALVAARRFDEAVDQWLEAAALQPDNPVAWAGLGNALGLAGRPGEAVEALERSVELAPEDSALMARLAFAEHAAGRPADAARDLARAADAWADGPFPHAGALGILLYRAGRAEAARPWLARSRPTEPEYPEARLTLARVALGAGDREAARRALAEALAAAPALRTAVAADPALAPLVEP
jgi:arylsulfatase A-like enzyme/tetratricopeptide (TPR) repeat protein